MRVIIAIMLLLAGCLAEREPECLATFHYASGDHVEVTLVDGGRMSVVVLVPNSDGTHGVVGLGDGWDVADLVIPSHPDVAVMEVVVQSTHGACDATPEGL